ncbi:hypothetical protein EIP86_001314 [Pleurotus ostreatoroseus]|nr:hypothetical protein EIP86_001314 [Pleurotus ostreatoroseus]
MNFFDAYDVSGPGTPREGPDPTLNEEVTQVVGQISRLWGGFRKQSQTVLETARKDLGQVVTQAQKELTKLTTEDSSNQTTNATTSTADPTTEASTSTAPPAEKSIDGTSEASSSTGNESPETPIATSRPEHARTASVSVAAQNLFSRIQSSLPANLASTVQAQLPESLRQGAGSIDLAQLRTTLTTEFQRVQGVTRAQAEEYVHRSEGLLHEASEFLKDAVKVVPPESSSTNAGVLWDGSDVWMLPDMPSASDAKGKGKERQSGDGRSSGEVLRAGATRAEALLTQLRHDPEVIKADPATDPRTKELWEEWVKKEVDSEAHGILSEKWTIELQQALQESQDGGALQKTMEILVPSVMTSETFWTRYFFRVHQVEAEEERRKALIQGTAESEEDISWESDDDETADSTTGTAAPAAQSKPTTAGSATLTPDASHDTINAAKPKTSVASTPASGSPRQSSEGSYDVVSSQVSNAEDTKPSEGDHKDDADDDEDSDWE